MSSITRALLLLAPRRRVRQAFTRHYERRDWDEPETVSGRGDFHWFSTLPVELDSYLGIEVVEGLAATSRESVEDSRYTDKSFALWPLQA